MPLASLNRLRLSKGVYIVQQPPIGTELQGATCPYIILVI